MEIEKVYSTVGVKWNEEQDVKYLLRWEQEYEVDTINGSSFSKPNQKLLELTGQEIK